MFRRAVRFGLVFLSGAAWAAGSSSFAQTLPPDTPHEIIVYGGTAGGVMAAVQAARLGKSVVLIEPGRHIGGLTSGGLGATDIGNKAAIGGLSREFYRRVGQHYADPAAWKWQKPEEYRSGRQKSGEEEMWTFTPTVAENILKDFLNEAKVPVVFLERLDLKKGVLKEGKRIVGLVMESGRIYRGQMFIDATYEGDLMALAGVKYTVGREANAQYKETLNGVQTKNARSHQFKVAISPYRDPEDPSSALLPGLQLASKNVPGEEGSADRRVQAYNFRMCLTDVPENRIPFERPINYDPLRYELLLRYIKSGTFDAFGSNLPMPNRKTDTNNNGGFSTDNIGMNYDYPDGDYATRDRIFFEHLHYQQGLMYFLANDARLPSKVRNEMSKWGVCKDEFVGTAGWSHQMYVREARRMISDVVMTQHHCQGRETAADPVGLAAYTMDSHNVQRYVKDSRVYNEGDVQVGGFPPYPISWQSIRPKKSECENLAVPVCLAATHIAYGSIRMEPVFMVLGQSAATACAQALDEKVAIQDINYPKLQQKLLEDKQVLEWTGPKGAVGLDPAKLPGMVLDDAQAKTVGGWSTSSAVGPFVGSGYLHDAHEEIGQKSAKFTFRVPSAGLYQARMSYSPQPNRATNVPVKIGHAAGEATRTVNQRQAPGPDGFVDLGTYTFAPDRDGTVEISNAGADGHVIVDAIQLLPAK